jgi:hypothetical protein
MNASACSLPGVDVSSGKPAEAIPGRGGKNSSTKKGASVYSLAPIFVSNLPKSSPRCYPSFSESMRACSGIAIWGGRS